MAPGLVVRSAVFTLLSPGSWEMANSTAVFVVRISYIYFEFASSDGPPCDAMKVYYSLVVRPLPPPGILRLMLRAPPRVLEYAAWIFYHESRSWQRARFLFRIFRRFSVVEVPSYCTIMQAFPSAIPPIEDASTLSSGLAVSFWWSKNCEDFGSQLLKVVSSSCFDCINVVLFMPTLKPAFTAESLLSRAISTVPIVLKCGFQSLK